MRVPASSAASARGTARGSDAADRCASLHARVAHERGKRGRSAAGCVREAVERRVVGQQLLRASARPPRTARGRRARRRPSGRASAGRARDRCRASACRCTGSGGGALRARGCRAPIVHGVGQALRQVEFGQPLRRRARPAPRPGPAARASPACGGSSRGLPAWRRQAERVRRVVASCSGGRAGASGRARMPVCYDSRPLLAGLVRAHEAAHALQTGNSMTATLATGPGGIAPQVTASGGHARHFPVATAELERVAAAVLDAASARRRHGRRDRGLAGHRPERHRAPVARSRRSRTTATRASASPSTSASGAGTRAPPISPTSAIAAAVDKALAIARYTAEDPAAGLADPARLARGWPDLDLYHPWDLPVEAGDRARAAKPRPRRSPSTRASPTAKARRSRAANRSSSTRTRSASPAATAARATTSTAR